METSLCFPHQQLSDPAFVFRPFDRGLRGQVSRRIHNLQNELANLGYTETSSARIALQAAYDLICPLDFDPNTQPNPRNPLPLPYLSLTSSTKHLLDAVVALHTSSHAFPVENRHLPPEILSLIHDRLLSEEEDDPIRVRATQMALSATSVTWRNVSYPRLNVHIESVDRLDRWCSHQERLLAGRHIQNYAQLERLCIQLSEDLSDFDWFEYWRNQAFQYYFVDAKRLELNFDGPVPHDCDEYERFCQELSESLSCRDQFSVRIRHQPKEDLYTSFDLFTTSCDTRQSRTKFELYLGDPEVSCLPRSSDTQAWFDLRAEQDEPPVDFTKFRILAIPWHIFTIPQFLGTTYPIQTDLSDSLLLRLELTLEIDAQERDDTLDQVRSFFETISPRIQYLAIRLRLRTDHEDRADEWAFTRAFVDGLASCRRLKHLEIGGSGFSPDLPRHLAILPLTSLVLRHVHEPPSASDLFQLISPSAVSSRTLKQVRMPQYWTKLIEDISRKFGDKGIRALLHEGKREGDYLMRARIISGLVHFE